MTANLSLDAFREASKSSRVQCLVALSRRELEAKDLSALDAALADRSITSVAIAKVLTDAGQRLPASAVQRHRRAQCSCSERNA